MHARQKYNLDHPIAKLPDDIINSRLWVNGNFALSQRLSGLAVFRAFFFDFQFKAGAVNIGNTYLFVVFQVFP